MSLRSEGKRTRTRYPSRIGWSALSLALVVSACSHRKTLESPRSTALALRPGGDWHIGPEDDFADGALRREFVLANPGVVAAAWQVSTSEPWVTFEGPTAGHLVPSASVVLALAVDPVAAEQAGPSSIAGPESRVAHVIVADPADGSTLAELAVTVDTGFLQVGPGQRGWTRFAASADTRTVYVSQSTGSDLADGLSPSTPKRSLAAATALLRHGFPDWMLLLRGDVWYESLGQWKKSGRSATERMLVSTYGTAAARPRLETGAIGGIWTNGGGGSPATIDDLAIVGLAFHPEGYTGGGDCIGAQFLQPGSHVLVEDCAFEGYSVNVVFQGYGGRHTDFRLRRSLIADAYAVHAVGGHSQGLYAYAVDGLAIEENVFDHNGWNEDVPGAGADIYSHDLYIDNDNTDVLVRGNVIANASSHGLQLRPGGSVVNNLFVRDSIALSVGGGNNPDAGGVTADVRGNVIVDGKDIDAATPRGWGMWFANIASGAVSDNVIANNTDGHQPVVMTLDGQHAGDTVASIGVHELVIERNVLYDWGGGILVRGDAAQVTNITLASDDVQNVHWPAALLEHPVASSIASVHSASNHFYCQLVPVTAWAEIESVPHSIDEWFALVGDTTSVAVLVPYPDPQRSVASYHALLGGVPSLAAFLAAARQQSSRHWRPELLAASVNRYLRGGF